MTPNKRVEAFAMEFFTERLMRKNIEGNDIALSLVLLLISVAVCVCAFIFLGYIAFIVTFAVIYMDSILLGRILIKEYEYTLTNSSLDIDEIIARKSRKSLKSYDIKNMTEGGKADKNTKGEFLCASKASDNLYYLEYNEDGKREVVIIDPNDTMLKAFRYFMGNRFKI